MVRKIGENCAEPASLSDGYMVKIERAFDRAFHLLSSEELRISTLESFELPEPQ